jgi:hypothetical protein
MVAGRRAVGLAIAEPRVEAQVAGAELAREEPQLANGRRDTRLGGKQQRRAEAVPLAIGSHREPPDLGYAGEHAQLHGGDQAPGLADPERRHYRVGELGQQLLERLRERRQERIGVRLRLGDVRRALQRQQLPGVGGGEDLRLHG